MPLDRDGSKPASSPTPKPGVNGASRASAQTSLGLTGGGVSGDPLRANLALMAPGTALRDGLERILRGRTGALIVLGYDSVVESICTGGFPLDVEFSATRLR
ncbi:MAG TPA: DNA integrity scanning protein DisA, partial [Actinomycetota bacterium]